MIENPDNFPTVKLAGEDYPVKPLVIKQMRIVLPAFMRLRKLVEVEDIKDAMFNTTEEQIDDILQIVYTSIVPCKKGLTFDQFTDLAISPIELFLAMPVIAKQAGLTPKGTAPGEAPAGTTASSTGTAS